MLDAKVRKCTLGFRIALGAAALSGCALEQEAESKFSSELGTRAAPVNCVFDAGTSIAADAGTELPVGSEPAAPDAGMGPGVMPIHAAIKSVRSSSPLRCDAALIAEADGGTAIALSNFVAGNTELSMRQLNHCYLKVEVDVPDGYTYSVETLDLAADVSVDQGASFRVHASYKFGFDDDSSEASHEFFGPLRGQLAIPSVIQVQPARGCRSKDPISLWLNISTSRNADGAMAFVNLRKIVNLRINVSPCG